MTGATRKAPKRGTIKVWLWSDTGRRAILASVSVSPPTEHRPGVWLGKMYTNDLSAIPDGLLYVATYEGRVVESNHPHWRSRVGFQFGERQMS